MPSPAELARAERLMEAWRVLLSMRDDAKRWDDVRRIEALGTVLKILDACMVADDGVTFAEDAPSDRAMMVRLREIARIRDIFASERKPAEAEAESTA